MASAPSSVGTASRPQDPPRAGEAPDTGRAASAVFRPRPPRRCRGSSQTPLESSSAAPIFWSLRPPELSHHHGSGTLCLQAIPEKVLSLQLPAISCSNAPSLKVELGSQGARVLVRMVVDVKRAIAGGVNGERLAGANVFDGHGKPASAPAREEPRRGRPRTEAPYRHHSPTRRNRGGPVLTARLGAPVRAELLSKLPTRHANDVRERRSCLRSGWPDDPVHGLELDRWRA